MEDDIFNTPEFSKTLPFSTIQRPTFFTSSQHNPPPATKRHVYFHHKEEVDLLKCPSDSFPILDIDSLKTFSNQVSLQDASDPKHLDYFSKPHHRQEIAKLKSQIQSFSEADLKKAHILANPYSEALKAKEYKYPDGIKMLNLVTHYPTLITENNLFDTYNFVTLGEHGGYSEFVIKHEQANLNDVKGFALYPKGEIQLDDLTTYKSDVISLKEIIVFTDQILENIYEPSCMLVLSTLSFNKDEKTHKLYMCYSFYITLKLMSKGGTLVFKTNSTHTPCTMELLYVISRYFEEFSISKPLTSYPESDTRYIICLGFKGERQDLDNLAELCIMFENLFKINKDLVHILDFNRFIKDKDFQKYVYDQNARIHDGQIRGLQRVVNYLSNSHEPILNKQDVTRRCFIWWKIEQPIEIEPQVERPPPKQQPNYKLQKRTQELPMKRDRPPDLTGLKFLERTEKKVVSKASLPSLARPKPNEVVKERSIDLSEYYPDEPKDLSRFLNRNQKKKPTHNPEQEKRTEDRKPEVRRKQARNTIEEEFYTSPDQLSNLGKPTKKHK